MASRTSKTGVVNRGTAGGDSYYVTDVSTLSGGGVRTKTYRTDGAGKNKVLIRTIDVNNHGEITKNENTSDTTIEEQRDFLNSKSTLNRIVKDQVNEVRSDLQGEVTSDGGNADGVTDQIFDKAAGGSGNVESTSTEQVKGFLEGFSLDTSKGVPLSLVGNRRLEYENLFYPEDIATSKQDRIRF